MQGAVHSRPTPAAPSTDATRWTVLFEQSPQSLQVFGPDGWSRRVNSAWKRLFRLNDEGAASFNILKDAQFMAAGVIENVAAAFAGNIVHIPPVEYVVDPSDPSGTRWLTALLFPVFGPRGNLVEVVGLYEDITERRQAEVKLRENQELLQSITRNVTEAIYRSSPSGKLTFVNDAYLRLFRFETLESLNVVPREALYAHPTERARLLQLLTTAGGFRNQEIEFRRRDGTTFWGLISSSAHRDPVTGELKWFDGIITDVSDRREAEQSIRVLNATLEERVRKRTRELAGANERLQREIADRQRREATLRAVWQISEAVHAAGDLDQLFVRIHAIVGSLMPARNFYLALHDRTTNTLSFPYYTDDISSPPPPRPFGDGLTEYVMRTRRPLLATRQVVEDLIKRGEHTPHGPRAEVWLGVPLVAAGETVGAMAVQDYSEPHAFGEDEQQLLTFVAEQTALAIERKRAEANLLHTLERERELGQLRKDFVSMVSHEFRTPLGIIISSAGLLERYFDRLDPAERAEHLASIRSSTRRMSHLMEEVLLFGRVDEGRAVCEPKPMNLAPFCRQLADELRSATDDRCPIRVRIGSLPETEVALDERLLRPVLTNLITNAVKYSPHGSPVDFSTEAIDGQLVFTVKDRGCGIPASDLPALFEPFRRGTNVGHVPGTGLGLAIVRRCIRLHGGTIDLASEVGSGTTAVVKLPISIPSAPVAVSDS